MTILLDDDNNSDYRPLYVRENRGWTDQEAKDFIKEVERLKEIWYSDVVINAPEVSIREALANLRSTSKTYLRIIRENEECHGENERRKQERLRKIKEENKNLEWPKPSSFYAYRKICKPYDYWRDGCLYCEYKPQTTHDYEVHIVTRHHGRPAYPGPADVELSGLHLREEEESKVSDMAAANESGNGIMKYNNSNNNIECQD